MASKLICRNLVQMVDIRSVLLNSLGRRTPIKIGRSFGVLGAGAEKKYRSLNKVLDGRRGIDFSSRTKAVFANRDLEGDYSDEISCFESGSGSEWMQFDTMDDDDDDGWYRDIHEKMPDNITSVHGIKDLSNKKEDAEKMAIQWLAKRALTTSELTKKLQGKNFHPSTTKSVINELKNRGFLDDGLYAESFSRSRWTSLNWGPQRIKQVLRQKGVNNSDIARAIDLVFKDESGKSEYPDGISEVSMNRLLDQASKQWLRGQTASLTNRRARIVRWLQYRGFDWAVTSCILKKLESMYPP